MEERLPLCPDPACGAFLDKQEDMHHYRDPHTSKVLIRNSIGSVLLGCGTLFLFWLSAGMVLDAFFSGSARGLLGAKIIAGVGIGTGIVGRLVVVTIFERRRKAALSRADRFDLYLCPRCGKQWWLKTESRIQTIP